MKKIYCLLLLLSTGLLVKAQSNADLQKKIAEAKERMKALQSNPEIAAKMKMAQHITDSLNNNTGFKKKMSTVQSSLDSIKEKNPELAKYDIPQIGQVKMASMPNIDSINANLDQSSQRFEAVNNAIDQTTPKLNPFHHAEKLHKLSQNEMLAIANHQFALANGNLNPLMLTSLKQMVKDTNVDIVTTGAFLLASGADKNVAVYLICSAIFKKPNDEWAINDLGVYLRDKNDLEKSLQCYFYANAINNEKDTAINTNIGWASAYYGDFETALKYFDKALTLGSDYQSANEGKALIAYAKGDIATLFQCLAKEVKYIGGGGIPSESFTRMACQAATDKYNQEAGKEPSEDNTFNNNLPDDAPDTPPGADVDDVTLTQFKKVFVSKPEEIGQAAAFGLKQLIQVQKQLGQEVNNLTTQLSTLKPLGQKPYVDEEGYVIYPSNFEKYVIPLTPIRVSYHNRIQWWQKKFYEKLKPFGRDVWQHDQDLIHSYMQALGKCNDDDACEKKVKCEWIPKIIYPSKNNDLEALAQLWTKYYNHVFDAVNWYLSATAPFISRVHQEGWNLYLNAYRKHEVKLAYYELYAAWVTGLQTIATDFCAEERPEELTTCTQVPEGKSVSAPDPFSKKPKHIKEFEGPCPDIPFDLYLGKINHNCHGDKFEFGNDNLNLAYSHTTDKIAAENQGYTHDVNFTSSVEKDFTITKIAEKDVSVKGELKGNLDMKFDNDWNFTSGSSSVEGSASMGKVQIVDAQMSRTAQVVSGQLNVSSLSLSASGPAIK